ncbi:MAG: 3D domain-containing protein [Vicinamibacterales bacterium]
MSASTPPAVLAPPLPDRRGLPGGSITRRAFYGLVLAFVVVTAACAARARPGVPSDGAGGGIAQQIFTATAYCTGTVTATGRRPNERTVAADPAVLPMGTRIRLSGLETRFNREYVVGDTGGQIRGRRLDLYMRDCDEAVAFGRRTVRVSVLR